ncbi:hypothetical protein ACJMK2_016894 [Sinanodonta woodiana]|uniref:Uncharacterized protein n=1 Tax=Sinanodonta woodiana TaxID=1069815 RepID=A0ABD3UWF3_SINWO
MAAKEDGLSGYVNGLSNEAGSCYMQKLNSIKDYKGLLDPYNLKCEWMSDPSIWPDFTFGDIYCYLKIVNHIHYSWVIQDIDKGILQSVKQLNR